MTYTCRYAHAAPDALRPHRLRTEPLPAECDGPICWRSGNTYYCDAHGHALWLGNPFTGIQRIAPGAVNAAAIR